MRVRQNVLTALLAAALCVMAPISVPLGPVPVTFATVGVYLAAGILGPWRGAAAVGLYLLLGGIGVPVFAGFGGGFPHLFGLTGGFLWGYFPCVVVVGLLCRIGSKGLTPLWLACGAVLLYAVGVTWYLWQSGIDLAAALLICVVYTLPGEAMKIAVATALILPLRRWVGRLTAVGDRK